MAHNRWLKMILFCEWQFVQGWPCVCASHRPWRRAEDFEIFELARESAWQLSAASLLQMFSSVCLCVGGEGEGERGERGRSLVLSHGRSIASPRGRPVIEAGSTRLARLLSAIHGDQLVATDTSAWYDALRCTVQCTHSTFFVYHHERNGRSVNIRDLSISLTRTIKA